MLYRFPKAFEGVSSIKLKHAGNSVVVWFRLLDRQEKAEGFLTENTLVFVIRGTKQIHLHDRQLTANAGDLILLKRGTYFMSAFMTGETDYQALMVCADDALLRSFLQDDAGITNITPVPHQAPMVVPCTAAVLQVRDTMISYLEHPHSNTTKLLELKIREVLLLLLSGSYQQPILSFLYHMFDSSAESIVLTIKSHLLKPITLEEYAKMCGLSLSAFKREFSRLYNAPPKKWINEERLKHAHYLLQHTPLNVNEIADECGFEHVSYFIKQYKAQYGTTPKNAQRTKTAIY
ncbi:helix-turn-helix transcriptional regulator [Chitinophaga nivalis]|uniref:AraC family transcriptional regulator n=1 Tax=Chitinophaga nivalis TaxID=2991709 RepID=A0ABT3IG71_9BACT|nr:AraC family transcriptional regulator [Chitinophaga nivalis]MCW3467350.1 AraC family transcriptional regulator [Chitinophaga nivalis]MCW3482958.1 AraC family transcriptional regulator [Chitinophaga nivalis]